MKNISLVLVLMGLGLSNLTVAQGDVFLSGYSVNSLVRVNNDVILAGTDKGLWRYTNGQWAVVPNLSTYIINDIAIGANKNVWIATNGRKVSGANTTYSANGGVFLLETPLSNDTISWGSIDGSLGGLTSRNVTGIELDAAQNIWTSHSYHNKSATSAVRINGGLSYRKFNTNYTPLSTRTAFEQKNGALPDTTPCFPRLMETLGNGADTTVWTSIRKFFITTPCSIDTTNILYRFDKQGNPNGYIDYTFFPVGSSTRALLKSKNAFVRAIYTDKNKNTWFGFSNLMPSDTSRGILIRKFDGTWVHIPRSRFPIAASVMRNAIGEDVNGKILIGTDKGLLIYKITTDFINPDLYSVTDTTGSSLTSARVQSVFFNAVDTFNYVGTDVGGFKVKKTKTVWWGIVNDVRVGIESGGVGIKAVDSVRVYLYNINSPSITLDSTYTNLLGQFKFDNYDSKAVNKWGLRIKKAGTLIVLNQNYNSDNCYSEACVLNMPFTLYTQVKDIVNSLENTTIHRPILGSASETITAYNSEDVKVILADWSVVSTMAKEEKITSALSRLLLMHKVLTDYFPQFDSLNVKAVEGFDNTLLATASYLDIWKKLVEYAKKVPVVEPIITLISRSFGLEKLGLQTTVVYIIAVKRVILAVERIKIINPLYDKFIPSLSAGIDKAFTKYALQDNLKSSIDNSVLKTITQVLDDNVLINYYLDKTQKQKNKSMSALQELNTPTVNLNIWNAAVKDIEDSKKSVDETRARIETDLLIADVASAFKKRIEYAEIAAIALSPVNPPAAATAASFLKIAKTIAKATELVAYLLETYNSISGIYEVTPKAVTTIDKAQAQLRIPEVCMDCNAFSIQSINALKADLANQVNAYNDLLKRAQTNIRVGQIGNALKMVDSIQVSDSLLSKRSQDVLHIFDAAYSGVTQPGFDSIYLKGTVKITFSGIDRLGIQSLLLGLMFQPYDTLLQRNFIDYADSIITLNNQIIPEVESMGLRFNGIKTSAYISVSSIDLPRRLKPSTSFRSKIKIKNFGLTATSGLYAKIICDKPLRSNIDSVFIGRLDSMKEDSFYITFIAPSQNDTIVTFSVNFYADRTLADNYNSGVLIKDEQNTGLKDIQLNDYFTVSPNPTTAKITLKQTNAFAEGPLSINVSNGVGQVVWQQKVGNVDGYVIDLGDKPNGLYFVKVSLQDGRFQTEKVLIQH